MAGTTDQHQTMSFCHTTHTIGEWLSCSWWWPARLPDGQAYEVPYSQKPMGMWSNNGEYLESAARKGSATRSRRWLQGAAGRYWLEQRWWADIRRIAWGLADESVSLAPTALLASLATAQRVKETTADASSSWSWGEDARRSCVRCP